MSRWIVFEPPASGAEPGPSDRARFVRDRFAAWAVPFPFLWLFRHGLVLAGLLALALSVGFGVLAGVPGFGLAATLLPLLLGVLVALEGPSLRAARLRRKGWREAGVAEAGSEAEAAILYYAAGTSVSPPAPAPAPSPVASRSGPPSRAKSLLDPPRMPI